jgi:hypothetical protein
VHMSGARPLNVNFGHKIFLVILFSFYAPTYFTNFF